MDRCRFPGSPLPFWGICCVPRISVLSQLSPCNAAFVARLGQTTQAVFTLWLARPHQEYEQDYKNQEVAFVACLALDFGKFALDICKSTTQFLVRHRLLFACWPVCVVCHFNPFSALCHLLTFARTIATAMRCASSAVLAPSRGTVSMPSS